MTRRRGSLLLIGLGLLLALTTAVTSALAHEPEQTTPVPGFQPESPYAAAFVDSLATAQIAVLPTIIRRAERTAHSFSSQQTIIADLNASGITTALPRRKRIEMGPLQRVSQWQLFQYGLETIAGQLEGYDTGADYTLVMEILVPGDEAVFGIEVYILDGQRRSAFSFLLNSHHQMFADAKLVSRGTSEASRQEMIHQATEVGLAAFKAQVERARQPRPPRFSEVRLDENSSRVTIDTAQYSGLAVGKTMTLMCECAALTVDRGFRFFRIDEQAMSADGLSTFRITFFHEVPEGMPVAGDWSGGEVPGESELMNAAIDARQIMRVCY